MHDEGLIAGDGVVAFRPGGRSVIRRLGRSEVRNIQAGPGFLLLIPPDQLFAFAPRRAVRAGGGTVVNNSTVGRPCKTPAMTVVVVRVTLACTVVTFFGKNAGVNPATAGRR